MNRRVGAGIIALALAVFVALPGTAGAGGIWGGGKHRVAVSESIIWGGGHNPKPHGLVWGGGQRAGWDVMLSAVLAGLRSRFF